eukprot:6490372-Prymnesium_polylepis.1
MYLSFRPRAKPVGVGPQPAVPVGGGKEMFGLGRTHTTRIPTCTRRFGECNARMLGTQPQPQRAQNTLFHSRIATACTVRTCKEVSGGA